MTGLCLPKPWCCWPGHGTKARPGGVDFATGGHSVQEVSDRAYLGYDNGCKLSIDHSHPTFTTTILLAVTSFFIELLRDILGWPVGFF